MRIASWNVNGLRAIVRKGFVDWWDRSPADVIGLQETRCTPAQVPSAVLRSGWSTSFCASERNGYSGVGVLSQLPIADERRSLAHKAMDREGRVQLVRVGRLWLANVYFPNGNGVDRDNSRVPFKLRFYRRLLRVLEELGEGGNPVLVMGDFNSALEPRDLARPKQNQNTSGFLPEERAELARWLRRGWVDTFRAFCDEPGHYTWWSQRRGVRARNIGWRIDLALVNEAAAVHLRGAGIEPKVLGSDHCPIWVELDDAVLG